jgi:hypothetical protein
MNQISIASQQVKQVMLHDLSYSLLQNVAGNNEEVCTELYPDEKRYRVLNDAG